MNEGPQAMHPDELRFYLAPYLPSEALPLLDALVNKATRRDAECAICYEAALREGAREAQEHEARR